MSKLTLTFNLPEEREEAEAAAKAGDYRRALTEILQLLRKYRKYGVPVSVIESGLEEESKKEVPECIDAAQTMNDHIEQEILEIVSSYNLEV